MQNKKDNLTATEVTEQWIHFCFIYNYQIINYVNPPLFILTHNLIQHWSAHMIKANIIQYTQPPLLMQLQSVSLFIHISFSGQNQQIPVGVI